jgi:hypothetical protein
MKYFEIVPFVLNLTPERIAEAVQTLTEDNATQNIKSEPEEG